MKILKADGRKEFIVRKFGTFCKKKGISIKYTAAYVHKKNRLIKQK